MEVRDAVEADAEALAVLADAPVDVMRNLVHDRTVRVVADARPEGSPAEEAPTEPTDMSGFVSYDARENTVYVTQLGGSADVCAELLAEPIQFARRENMDVEVLVPAEEDDLQAAVEGAGFAHQGPGPRFDGSETIRYLWSD
jgi:hypothetical protein